MSRSSMLDVLALSCGTPSKYVVIPGLFGLELMPRNRALLSFRADHSVKYVFGAKIAASLTMWMAALSMVSLGTAVTLAGTLCMSSGSFCAVTVTVGMRNRRASSCEEFDWVAPADCAEATAGASTRSSACGLRATRDDRNMCAIMHICRAM